MEEFARYDAYKNSGVEWLGRIPGNWNLIKSKYLWKETEDRSVNGDETLLSVSQYNGVLPNTRDSRSETLVDYKNVNPNELVINIMLAWMGGLSVSDYKGIVSPAYCVYRQTKNNSSKYFSYLYRTQIYLSEFARRSKGVVPSRWRMYTDDFGQVLTLLPPLSEQNKIVAFLDQKTTEIDEAITKKQRLIELLNEQKDILIDQAVTKGINPDIPKRDSGVEWIGKIPEHWKMKRLRLLGITQNGISAGAEYFGSGYPFVSYSDVYNNIELPKSVKGLAKSSEQDRKQYSIRKGDVLFTRTSETIDEIGYSSVCTDTIENSTFAGFLIRFRPKKGFLNPRYSKYFFSAKIHRFYFVKEMNLITRASLSQELLKNLPVLLPPYDEQNQIASYCTELSKVTDKVIGNERLAIVKLKEFKETLIAHAVTGKFKV